MRCCGGFHPVSLCPDVRAKGGRFAIRSCSFVKVFFFFDARDIIYERRNPLRKMAEITDFGPRKTIFILAIVASCFAVLWPKIFYPMLTASVTPHQPTTDSSGKIPMFTCFKIIDDVRECSR